MKPKHFPGQNIIFGKDQPQYQQLPALLMPGREGEVITCWEFSDVELEAMIKNKCFYFSQLCFTFINEKGELQLNALQPILPMAELGDNIKLTFEDEI